MASLWVLLPAYNEAECIGDVVSGVAAVHSSNITVIPLVVDDGSKDRTADIAREAGATVVVHQHNRGVGAAFRTGKEFALAQGADYLIHMDADGQLLPAEIPQVFAPVRKGEADLVLGSRFLHGTLPANLARWKGLALTSTARAIGLCTGYALTDISCGFRCMNRRILQVVNPSFDYDYIQETLIQALAAHARVVEVPITALYPEQAPKVGDIGGAVDVRQRNMSSRVLRYGTRFLGLTGYAMLNFYLTRGRERGRELLGHRT